MNDIYWHNKRTMPSKQLSSPPPTQPRRSYENTIRTKQHQPMDVRLNSHSAANRTDNSSYLPYHPASNRSHTNNVNFPYTSSLYGVYHESPPTIKSARSPIHPNQDKYMDLKNHAYRSEQRHLSRSASEDYYITKYHESNGLNNEVYDDEEVNGDDDDEENCSEIFNYTFDDAGVSLKKYSSYV